jgi:iron-regulated transporter 1
VHKPAAPEHHRQPLFRQFLQWPQHTLSSWKIYYRSPLFSASLSLCILYFTVLSFGGNHILNFQTDKGSMIAFLSQYCDFSTPLIAGLRAIAVVVGIAATFLSPPVIRWIGPVRSGIWFLSWQTIFLAPVPVALFLALNKRLQGGLLVGFVSISRLGLWGFDLSEQYLVQQVAHPLSLADNRKLKRQYEESFPRQKQRCSHCLMYCSIRRRSYSRNRRCSSILC